MYLVKGEGIYKRNNKIRAHLSSQSHFVDIVSKHGARTEAICLSVDTPDSKC